MADIQTGYPKNMAFNLRKLDAGFSKSKVKILPDTTTVSANGIIRFRLSGNSIYDFRSLVLYMTGKTEGTSSTPAGLFLHFPRYVSSLIKNISITANNTVLCSINEYGTLYNALMDMEGGDYSQSTKRCTELFDPTIRYTQGITNENKITAGRLLDSADAGANSNDSGVNMCINNFLGFLNSLSTPCIDLTDIGDIYINIQFENSSVLWHSNFPNGTTATNVPTFTGANFTLSNIFMTIDKISFQSPEYYNLKTEKLLEDGGLTLAYYDYFLVAGSLTTKSSGVAMNFNVNSASLDQCIATFRREDYNKNLPLVMYGSTSIGPVGPSTIDEYNANPVGKTNNVAGATGLTGFVDIGDGFGSSIAFVRPGNDLTSTQWSINSVNISAYPETPIEIWNKNLHHLGFMNQDLGSSGVHVGCKSLLHFLKYYFIDVCSLENVSGDNSMWVSGLDGRQGGINIQYNATFASTNGQKVFPLIWCRSTNVLQIKAGRQLVINPPSM